MKRTSETGRRGLSLRPLLEPLEDRLVPSAAPVVGAAAAPLPALPISISVPGGSTLLTFPPGHVLPVRDDVFFNALLTLGGGQHYALPHFPESGAGGDRSTDETASRVHIQNDVPDAADVQGQAFGGDLGPMRQSLARADETLQSIDRSLTRSQETATLLSRMAEALVQAE